MQGPVETEPSWPLYKTRFGHNLRGKLVAHAGEGGGGGGIGSKQGAEEA